MINEIGRRRKNRHNENQQRVLKSGKGMKRGKEGRDQIMAITAESGSGRGKSRRGGSGEGKGGGRGRRRVKGNEEERCGG